MDAPAKYDYIRLFIAIIVTGIGILGFVTNTVIAWKILFKKQLRIWSIGMLIALTCTSNSLNCIANTGLIINEVRSFTYSNVISQRQCLLEMIRK
jgi:hypothetical protein